MSAGVCGKRVGFEEIFGSSSAAKRSRCSGFGSPTRSTDFGSGSDDTLFTLLQMFPSLDPELVRTAHRNHNNKVDDAVKTLMKISFGDAVERNKLQSFESATIGNCDAVPPMSMTACLQMPEEEVEKKASDYENAVDGSKWVDLFVQEMMNAADLDDARRRSAQILEAFERSITAQANRLEQEHLQSLLNDNQILKRAVAIQHERNLEQEEKTKEVQNLKLLLNQYQEQIRSLELNNYALKLHLQRAQQNSNIPGHFNPDIC
ncbi:uncharacterized protein LOC8279585 isoform X2 [Ricinus communis]|uniref:uncharacterized protein LOC8279585 isoform X2 n=1 Tax=Ricinus communis TaxID=3988 RepID=UPI00077227D1|nr:uncharacterized protein LOC8279585 isoform X2 [Ricinus communis]|eukprot:XP_015580005.1 uncharacterized protein LOC8279585 isoform X2 [Ricinus communis]